jgi:hypothetical protein
VPFAHPLLVTGSAEHPATATLSRLPLRASSQADVERTFPETWLQTIIDQTPHVLPIDDFYPGATAVWSLGREIPVQTAESAKSIDNLLVTDDGHLVLVETKLARNREAIREVVAQVLQYAMAIGELKLLELEQAIRRGDPSGKRLFQDETIAMRAQRAADPGNSVAEDFEEALSRFRQRSEMLVLVVADGIQASAERLVEWISNTFERTSPLKFGLVELRVYDSPTGKIVVPKTLLRTREISRHTVVVEVRGDTTVPVKVSVRDGTPDTTMATRQVPRPETPLTRDALLEQVRRANAPAIVQTVEEVVAGLERLNLDTKGTPTTFQFGLKDGGAFYGLTVLSAAYVWCQIPARLRVLLGDDRFISCKQVLNRVAPFYRPEEVDDPTKVNALTPRYSVIAGRAAEFVEAITVVATICTEALAGR